MSCMRVLGLSEDWEGYEGVIAVSRVVSGFIPIDVNVYRYIICYDFTQVLLSFIRDLGGLLSGT